MHNTYVQFYVYLWTNTVNGKQYVGKGRGKRASDHLKRGYLLHQAIKKHGAENFTLSYVATELSESEALALEVAKIAELGTKAPGGYNLTDGGEGTSGWRHSEEHIFRLRNQELSEEHKQRLARMVAARRGKPMPEEQRAKMRRPKSEEHRRKMSEARLGRKHTEESLARMRGRKLPEETRRKISEALRKRGPMPEEHRLKISEANRGKVFSDEHRRKISEAAKRRHAAKRLVE